MTIDDMIARQTRIERQEEPHATSVSFDRNAANVFQAYVNESLGFSIKRGGVMYGRVEEDKSVVVEAIYEPPQQGSEEGLELTWDAEELKRVELVAHGLGFKKVGFIFSQSVSQVQGKEYIVSEAELRQMVELQVGEDDASSFVLLYVLRYELS
jgi:nuclear protein localization family protein 4